MRGKLTASSRWILINIIAYTAAAALTWYVTR
jgi:hypothetical protein